MPKQICTYPGCNNVQPEARCDEHKRQKYAPQGFRVQANKSFYNSKAWKIIRSEQLGEQAFCEIRHHCRGELATQVDHITPIECGGSERDSHNLQSVCARCHSWKTAKIDTPKIRAVKESRQ